MLRLVLLRHGESTWNKENRFTGWTDVDLSDKGREEAREAGRLMSAEKYEFDVAYTSVLKRAIRTLWTALDVMDQMWIPVHRSWRLNERHYGSLQGLDKAQMTAQHGEAQVKVWRRSYDVPPPPMKKSDPAHPRHDRRYEDVDRKLLPSTESLKTTLERVLPYWRKSIVPQLKAGQVVLVAAHGNSLRALYKHLAGMSDQEIVETNIPTGIPLLFRLDAGLKVKSHGYLGDPEAAKRAAAAVAAQAQAKA